MRVLAATFLLTAIAGINGTLYLPEDATECDESELNLNHVKAENGNLLTPSAENVRCPLLNAAAVLTIK